MKTNAERFLNAFVSLEMYLKDYLRVHDTSFSNMIAMASKKHPFIKRKQMFLIETAQLRNAIVHARVGVDDEIIAEPHIRIVEELERAVNYLEAKKTVNDFCVKAVYSVKSDTLIKKVLDDQANNNYSVVPAYEGNRYIGVLHNRLYESFLQKNSHQIIDLTTLTVADLLKYHRDDERIVFVSITTPIDEVIALCEKLYDQGKVLISIIITKTGIQNEPPLGILTPADLPKLMSELE